MFKSKLFLLVFMFFSLFFIYSENRVALVIGNSNYSSSPLTNPVRDARDMASSLEDLGFEVLLLTDSNKRDMLNAIRDFGSKLNQETVGLFYYAGHGVQVDGNNYLIPVNSYIETESDIEFEAVRLDRLIRTMEDSKTNKSLVFLDACRDNPYATSSRSGTRGLTVVSSNSSDKSAGSLIAFSTSPGAVASDGNGKNGTFTAALLKYMQEPGLEINLVMTKVRADVMESTNGKQQPWTNISLTEEFYFNNKNKDVISKIGSDFGALEVSVYDKAELFIDGELKEVIADDSTIYLTNITKGNHIIEFKYSDYIDKQLINVLKDDITIVKSDYEKDPFFFFNVNQGNVKNIPVYANNEFIGNTPVITKLPVKKYTISFKADYIETKEIIINPVNREAVELNPEDIQYKYTDVILKGLPEGSKVTFKDNFNNKSLVAIDNIVKVSQLIAGQTSLLIENDYIQPYKKSLNLNADEVNIIEPEIVYLGFMEFFNNNSDTIVVKLIPEGKFKNNTSFPDLGFNIDKNKSYKHKLPAGEYKVSYFKPGDDVPGLERNIVIEPFTMNREKIRAFDYSVTYRLNSKRDEYSKLSTQLVSIKKRRENKLFGGWTLVIGGLGAAGYGAYSYSQISSVYDNYNRATATSNALKYRDQVENLQDSLLYSSLIGGGLILVGSILNATLPDSKALEEKLNSLNFDIQLLESKLEN